MESALGIRSHKINLLPYRPEWLKHFYAWSTDVSQMYLWEKGRTIPPYEQFQEIMNDRLRYFYHQFFFIATIEAEQTSPIGATFSYEANLLDGYTFVGTVMRPDYMDRGLGSASTILILNYLFSFFPFRKVYFDVYEFNQRSLRNVKKSASILEGEFPKHKYFQGHFWTMYRFALYQDAFYQRWHKIIRWLLKNNETSSIS